MNKIILLYLISFSIINCQADFTPFSYDLKGVEATGDTVVVFGSLGTGMISFDNAESWQKIQPFRGDNIAQIFIEDNRMVAFSEFNKISVSLDGGEKWEVQKEYNDTINYIIRHNRDYYIRSNLNVMKLDESFEKEKTIKMNNEYRNNLYFNNTNKQNSNYHPILVANGNSIYIADYKELYKADINLNIEDSLSIDDSHLSRLYIKEDTLYANFDLYQYKINNFDQYSKFLHFHKLYEELFGNEKSYLGNYRVFNDNFYCLNKTNYNNFIGPYYRIYELLDSNNATFLGEIDLNDKNKDRLFRINDYVINKNKAICVSDDKLLTVYDMNTNENKIVSDLTGINYNRDYPIIYLNDTTMIYQIGTVTEITDKMVPKLLYSDDRGKSFTHIKSDSIVFNTNYRFKYRTFDEKSQTLYYLCINNTIDEISIIQSSDYGKTFKIDTVNNVNLQGYTIVTNFQKSIDGFIIGMGVSFSKEFSIVYQIDTDYNLVNTIKDTNYTLIKVKAKNRNELVSLNKITFIEDSIVDNYFIQHTTNAGVDWIRLGENGGKDDKDSLKGFVSVDEFSMKGKDYWLLYSYNDNDSLLTLKTFDLETYEYKLLYSFKTELFGVNYYKGISFASLSKNDTLYVSINDTIYVMPTLDNQSNWNRIQIPNNGYFGFRYPLNKFGNNFLGFYRDDYFPPSLYWVTFEDDGTTNIVESETQRNYLYTLPPYPLPSQNEVKVQFYWDINLPMTADDITVYDITGRKLITKDKIRLEKQSDHYGNLIWDCSGEEPGIYLINIKHGTEERSVKVVVE